MISIDLVQSKRDITYQIYDWHSKTLGEWKRLETRGIVIIEGVYSTRSELRDSYDVRVFVSTPDDLRQERMTARNQNSTVWREKWLASEAYYKQHESPSEFAHFVLVGGVVE